jgi:hypothetical protein
MRTAPRSTPTAGGDRRALQEIDEMSRTCSISVMILLAALPAAVDAGQAVHISPIADLVGCNADAPPIVVWQTNPRDDQSPSALPDLPKLRTGNPLSPPMPNDYFFADGEIASSPKPIHLDGDARPGIVFGNSLGQIYVLTADGVPAPGWPVMSGSQVGYSSAAVADLDGDGVEDIVVHANSQLQAYAQDGTALPGWPQSLDSNIGGNSLIGSPVIADIDNDGDLEVLVGHLFHMYAFHHDGTACAGWPINQSIGFGPLFATPAAGDLDGDGDLEICFKIYGGNGDPADIYLMHHDGTPLPGWPKLGLDRSHLSSPIIADVDGNGERDVIVSLHYFNSGNYVRVYAWRPDGTDVPGFPVTGSWNCVPENMSVGDVDDDGMLELFVGTANPTSPYYAVHAWNHDGTVLAGSWPRSADYCLMSGSPALADVNGGANEVVLGVGGCYVDDPGSMNVWDIAGSPLAGWPQTVTGKLRSSALVMDADADGTPEMYIGTTDGWIQRFIMQDATGGSAPEWNQIFGNPRNTNCYNPPTAPCPADVNGDGSVNVFDLLQLLDAWGDCPGCPEDLDGSGTVDVFDLLMLLGEWGPCG